MPTYLRADCYALYLVGVSDHLSDFKQNLSRYPPKPVSSYTSECRELDAMPLQCYFIFKSFHEMSYSYESLILSSSDLRFAVISHFFELRIGWAYAVPCFYGSPGPTHFLAVTFYIPVLH